MNSLIINRLVKNTEAQTTYVCYSIASGAGPLKLSFCVWFGKLNHSYINK